MGELNVMERVAPVNLADRTIRMWPVGLLIAGGTGFPDGDLGQTTPPAEEFQPNLRVARDSFLNALAIRRDFCVVSYGSRILCMPRGNPSPKLAITVDPDIHKNIRAAAARDGVSISAWMTAAAREALQRRAGLAAVALWEKQHGRFTTEEMNEARRSLLHQLRTSRTVRRSA